MSVDVTHKKDFSEIKRVEPQDILLSDTDTNNTPLDIKNQDRPTFNNKASMKYSINNQTPNQSWKGSEDS